MRSDSTDSIAGLFSISSSWRMAMRSEPSSATQNSVRRPSATTTPRAPPASACFTRSSMATFGSILPRDDLEPQRLELGGEARGQRIVLRHRQQHDTRPRRSAAPRRGTLPLPVVSACANAGAPRKPTTMPATTSAISERTDQ